MSNNKKPELLAPAGSWPSLLSAVQNGADSVYFGVKGANMRASASNFELSEIKKIMNILHGQKKRGYLALNTIVMNDKMNLIKRILKEAKKASVDAIILWDVGVFNIAKQMGLSIHLSTQASVSNSEAIQFYNRMGAKRIVLARECTLQQIQEIKKELNKKQISCEIETFVHGAMCLSISGRCFMSKYSHNKSANQGRCTQPCRREYEIKAVDGGEHFLVGQDYVLSPRDLCTIDFIDELIDAGVDTFKIEGRMRSPEYSSIVTFVYRKAIDAYYEGGLDKELKEKMKQKLIKVYNRGFSSGFYFGEPNDEKSRRLGHTHEKIFIGDVRKYYKRVQVADVLIRNDELKIGEEIIVFGKNTPASNTVIHEMQQEHHVVDRARKGEHVGVKIPFRVRKGDKVFLWRKKLKS
ncbi:MAG: U32 family peptidase [Candidatus Omnitrophica bacterium]|nr:U32 family peptidase [Chlamydiia bacterium]MCB9719812.1 U32 family peptidase [Candidatus Omnitrophota bacterium]